MGSEEVYEVKVIFKDLYSNLTLFTYQASLPDCLISEQDQKSCSGKSGTTSQPDIRLYLISGKPLSLINPAQANQAIRQTKEICNKSTL